MSASVLPANDAAIASAGELLRAGRLVGFPTETVYGLGGDATNEHAVAAIYAAKGRPHFNPLIVHVPDLETAEAIAAFDKRACRVAAEFWPGPLTLVLPRRPESGLSLLASAGLDTVAVRVPAHPVAQAVMRTVARPIAAPSANRSGQVSPTTAVHVMAELGEAIDLILDGGTCAVGVESTVLDLTGAMPVLLRPGGVTWEALSERLGVISTGIDGDPNAPCSPGQLASHYAPRLPVRLDARMVRPGEAMLGFGPNAAAALLNLSPAGDLAEAAANLFAMLRTLDRPEFTAIAVMPVPEHGLGRAINDRLRRAAADRG